MICERLLTRQPKANCLDVTLVPQKIHQSVLHPELNSNELHSMHNFNLVKEQKLPSRIIADI
jgi:hypothetical protein